MTDPQVIDQSALAALSETTGDDPAFLADLIDVFLTDAVELFTTMEGATADGDAEALRRAAHSLKSNSATLGATALNGLSRSIEELGKAADLESALPLIAEARAEFARVEQRLTEIRTSL